MLKQQIQNDSNEFLKSKNQFSLGVLRMALSTINVKEKEKRYKASKENPGLNEEDLVKKSELSDDQIIDVISSEIKKRKDAISLYQKGNRQELADQEKKEIEILQKYLPQQLSNDELIKLIKEAIDTTGAKELKDPSGRSGQVIGKIMAELMPKVKGKADNSEISKIIKELL
ncbi:MAG: hypothetical protein A3D34_02585 [Candidatus Staskawiczbacteria bacterium RIFCSPHIGHO2_02_FULL_33_16]|uniref:Aspartyl-tRNA amidotransferase n=1 Tax=Candidatus Staskawiczbacteria bacterium RIFCSPHIGHO2_02_FULL_33_16 TaxID=1802204 RepID=A0A1G2HU58_9BACT|nr:MAG: hypothetical protein A3D34_02585 [Candidatus Staskawiczbacteria bacterium RIFCSPHIGHO2_02_FULL_33_16]OGZ70795.1 MAG: hypothetical protein A2980_02075 [Candidatus Staskawiczbacteria bacterium RIFCSPLOWO2_01_FULL_33_13]